MSRHPHHPYLRPSLTGRPNNLSSSSSRIHSLSENDHPRASSRHSSRSYAAANNQASIFAGNNNLVTGGSFSINMASPDAGFLLLSEAASKNAMHDSSARDPPPKCHPETREEIVDYFIEWAKNDNPKHELVQWLHAPYGHGKSAVVQTIIDRLVEEGHKELIAGAFFFGRGIPGRNQARYLFPTIAYQIACHIPGMRQYINEAMMDDPTLPSKSLLTQLCNLIINPLLKCNNGPHFNYSPTVFIDGLDECDSIEDQLSVLNLIATALHQHHVPLRFLIASRPESHIRDGFAKYSLLHYHGEKELPNNDAEMVAYLTSRFDEIFNNRLRIMEAANIQKPWPNLEQIKELVRRACGQYVFLDTIIRSVSLPRLNPVTQLNVALRRLSDTSLFKDMDAIYYLILEQCPYQDILTVVLDHLLHGLPGGSREDAMTISEVWEIPLGDVRIVVESLAPVIRENNWNGLSFHHLSFREFLEDHARSGKFFCDKAVSSARWSAGMQKEFKEVLSGKWATRSLVDHLSHLLESEQGLNGQGWTTSSELVKLLHQGRSRTTTLGTEYFYRWFLIVDVIICCVVEKLKNCDPITRQLWVVGDLDTPFTAKLYNECLAVWKSLADETLAKLDPRLANAILQSEGTLSSDVVRAAGLNMEECPNGFWDSLLFNNLLEINKSSGNVFIDWCDRYYLLFDEQGNSTRLCDVRRQFYNTIQ
ncbi:hypothetical protein CPB83DRAFT_890415 [Crepidotus variabilis]|uniref:Nephrocystin 3-like N-terminal domain-containing protein n=1 Tax=Crepidotus variabilis TaxID=179855 RepID=A0A9P6EP08_9AGAR|nr:hypothetical protein CPB83DRAFT_890415 [Crepidotus variabilis]